MTHPMIPQIAHTHTHTHTPQKLTFLGEPISAAVAIRPMRGESDHRERRCRRSNGQHDHPTLLHAQHRQDRLLRHQEQVLLQNVGDMEQSEFPSALRREQCEIPRDRSEEDEAVALLGRRHHRAHRDSLDHPHFLRASD